MAEEKKKPEEVIAKGDGGEPVVETPPVEAPPAVETPPGEGDKPIEEAPTLKGRAAFLEKLRALDAELQDDISDDDLFDRAGGFLAERDEIRGKYDALNASNEQLARVISDNEEVAQFVAMLGSGENWIYALGKSFGNILEKLDDETLEKYNAGKAEFEKEAAQRKDNFAAYKSRLDEYAAANGLTDEQKAEVNNTILDIMEALMFGDIPIEVIDNVYKGLDYDSEKAAEAEAAKLAGRNEAIEEIKEKKKPPTGLPDLSSRKAVPKPVPAAKPRSGSTLGYVDPFADSEKIS